MTVIACKDGVIAADSGSWWGGFCFKPVEKLQHLRSGAIIGAAGDYATINAVQEWMDAGFNQEQKPPVEKDEDFDALELDPQCRVWRWDWKFRRYPITEPFAAIGSHWEFVMGAMAAGKSAVEAIELALKCGGNSVYGPVCSARIPTIIDLEKRA